MNNKFSLIYNTCDQYECLWKDFFRLWEKYWPSFDAQIILNTETKNFSYGNYNIVRPIFSKKILTWSERLYESLNIVCTPYVLFTLDDFYIKSSVDTHTLELCIEQMDKDESIKLFTFSWQPGDNKPCSFNEQFEQRARFAPYRVNAQIAAYSGGYPFSISGDIRSVPS